jgi:hypothetical protein
MTHLFPTSQNLAKPCMAGVFAGIREYSRTVADRWAEHPG